MFLPKKSKIFTHIVKQAETVLEATRAFETMVGNWPKLAEGAAALHAIEQRGDTLVHEVSDQIEHYFILPMDKEDIRDIAEVLDDIVDQLEEAAHRISIYNLPAPRPPLPAVAGLLTSAAHAIHTGITQLERHRLEALDTPFKELHRLEGEGDRLYRQGLQDLFGGNKPTDADLLTILKWKEIFDMLEDTLDCCERMAILFERLRIKYS